ncbi:hypothetical protein WJX73_005980 [Symbiochloris irregularis]|uniref:Uncharacterized protein n=1 Tax=Symbiochloris irregularis TaxID=706552 RepID=A0AAW1NT72_9CHLO
MLSLQGLAASEGSSRQASRVRLLRLALGALVFSLVFSYLQERVFSTEDFAFGGWVTFLTYATYTLLGGVEWVFVEGCQRQGRLRDFAGTALLATVGFSLTNYSLQYLDYATRVLFKSSKVLPVMAFGSLIQGKKYSLEEYASGAVLVFGIAIFTLGNKQVSPSFNMLGVLYIILALCCDAAVSNIEEKRFFRLATPCQPGEVLFLLSSFSGLYSLLSLIVSGELSGAVAHSWRHQHVVPFAVAASAAGYFAVSCVLALIRHYGALAAEVIKSLRKVLQVLASLLLFSKPLSWKYALGIACMMLAFIGVPNLKRSGFSGGLMQLPAWSGVAHGSGPHVYRPSLGPRDSAELEKIVEADEEGFPPVAVV